MPRRNLFTLLAVSVVSLICYRSAQNNRYGRILADAMDRVERRYLENVSQEELFEGAMEGMIDRLDDPYSTFISPKNLQEFHETLDRQFGGVGMEVGVDPKTGQLTVMSPLVGTPAYEAGIRAGDRILRINQISTQGLSLRDAVKYMRGKPGTTIVLSIRHEGEQQPQQIKIVRAIIQVDTVLGDTREADGSWNFFLEGHVSIGYLRINTFAENTAEELREALDRLIAHGMKGLILDLRDDPGGLLGAAVEVCDLFIDSGVIVTTRGRDRRIIREELAHRKGTYPDFPMAVLINRYSASASEIVAACLQDHGRAVVIGQRTWGKGTIQEVISLEGDQGALKLTTASYWRPSEKNIHRGKNAGEDDHWGVTPDEGYEVIVEGDELTQLRLRRLRRDVYKPADNGEPPDADQADLAIDPQLAAAVEYIEKAVDSLAAGLARFSAGWCNG